MSTQLKKFFSRPATKMGWWAVFLAITYLLLFYINLVFLVSRIPNMPGRTTGIPFLVVLLVVWGLVGSILGLVTVIWKGERSWMVWLSILPGLSVVYFLISMFLTPY